MANAAEQAKQTIRDKLRRRRAYCGARLWRLNDHFCAAWVPAPKPVGHQLAEFINGIEWCVGTCETCHRAGGIEGDGEFVQLMVRREPDFVEIILKCFLLAG